MDTSENLSLPYIMPTQSQKHVTHNEALRALDAIVQLAVADKDLNTPPPSPASGARYIVGASPTGSWSGHANDVAAWQDGAWAFYAPVAGWLAWVHDESRLYLYAGGGWTEAPGGGGSGLVPRGAWSDMETYATGDLVEHEGHAFLSNVNDNLDNEPDAETPGSTSDWTYFAVITGGGGSSSVNPVPLVGINDTADTTNRLAVSSPASLFCHEGADHQLKINKATASDTASVLFQTGFVGHAEFGLAGDDDFHVKVSTDGASWKEAIVIDRATGVVALPQTPQREVLTGNRTYYVRTDGNDSNDGSANTIGGAFLTIQRALDVVGGLDISIYGVTISIGPGTFSKAGANVLKAPLGSGIVTIQGAGMADTTVSHTGGDCFYGEYTNFRFHIRDMKIQTTGGSGLYQFGAGSITYWNIDFAPCQVAHVRIQNGGQTNTGGGSTISGGAFYHLLCSTNSIADIAARTYVLSGTPAFATAFIGVTRNAMVVANSITFSGSAAGPRHLMDVGGIVYTNGASQASYFPGSSAGTTTAPGAWT